MIINYFLPIIRSVKLQKDVISIIHVLEHFLFQNNFLLILDISTAVNIETNDILYYKYCC